MEVNSNELDLISQFRSMMTNEKESLIGEFKKLSNTNISDEKCSIYLDMANWDLNTALWIYYEYDTPEAVTEYSMTIEAESTANPDYAGPNIRLIKKWRIKNSGTLRWPPGCNLRYVNGTNLEFKECIIVNSLSPNESEEVTINFITPSVPGFYQTQFKLFTPTGTPFGDPIWLILHVKHDFSQQSFNDENMDDSEINNLATPSNSYNEANEGDQGRNDTFHDQMYS